MGQTLYNLTYHIIFSTKDREKCLTPKLRNHLYEFLTEFLETRFNKVHKTSGYLDHVHILCDLAPKHSLSYLVKEVKTSSSIEMKKVMKCHFSWQSGYGAFSVSKSNIPAVKEYLDNQEKHHAHKSFKEELIEFFDKNEIEFDERYLWN